MKARTVITCSTFFLITLLLAGCQPTVTISLPQDGATFEAGVEITFSGSASDPLEGELSGDALVWTSSIDGQIGTGSEFTKSDLSEGEHTITLTATNSMEQANSASITITIQPAEEQEEADEEQDDNEEDGQQDDGEEEPPEDLPLTITSSAFAEGEPIPEKYSCEGEDVSPDLQWSDVPEGTKSFVIIVDDPDAPGGTFTHWVVFDIPKTLTSITEGLPEKEQHEDIKEGVNDFTGSNQGYSGPCPPRSDPVHRYFFTIYALDKAEISLSEGAERSEVEEEMEDHILEQASLMGTYDRVVN